MNKHQKSRKNRTRKDVGEALRFQHRGRFEFRVGANLKISKKIFFAVFANFGKCVIIFVNWSNFQFLAQLHGMVRLESDVNEVPLVENKKQSTEKIENCFKITKNADLLVKCFDNKDEFFGEYNLGNIF